MIKGFEQKHLPLKKRKIEDSFNPNFRTVSPTSDGSNGTAPLTVLSGNRANSIPTNGVTSVPVTPPLELKEVNSSMTDRLSRHSSVSSVEVEWDGEVFPVKKPKKNTFEDDLQKWVDEKYRFILNQEQIKSISDVFSSEPNFQSIDKDLLKAVIEELPRDVIPRETFNPLADGKKGGIPLNARNRRYNNFKADVFAYDAFDS